MKNLLVLSALTILLSFQSAWAQDVGVIPEESQEPEPPRVTLKLAGAACEVNAVESVALHLKGVLAVDVESKKDHLIVDYDPIKVTPQQVVDAFARQKGCLAHIIK